MQFVTRHDNHPIAETNVLKLSTLANKVTSIGLCNTSFAGKVKPVMNFRAAFKKEHDVSFYIAQMVDIVDDMGRFDSLTDNNPQTSQCNICVTKFLHQQPIYV